MTENELTMNEVEAISHLSAKDKADLEKAQPMWKMVLSQFMDHKLAVVGAVVIAIFLFVAIFADQIRSFTNLDPDAQNVANRYLAPMTTAQAGQDVRETELERFITNHPEQAGKIQKALVEKGLVSVPEADAIYDVGSKDVPLAIETFKSLNIPETKDLVSIFDGFKTF
ncbi:MAG: ABC transporter permease, partial [Bdellovibrio sp.]